MSSICTRQDRYLASISFNELFQQSDAKYYSVIPWITLELTQEYMKSLLMSKKMSQHFPTEQTLQSLFSLSFNQSKCDPYPGGIYFVKIRQWKHQNNVWNHFCRFGVFIFNFEQISPICLRFLCCLWTSKCQLGMNSYFIDSKVKNFEKLKKTSNLN